jgi:hypothetical protein
VKKLVKNVLVILIYLAIPGLAILIVLIQMHATEIEQKRIATLPGTNVNYVLTPDTEFEGIDSPSFKRTFEVTDHGILVILNEHLLGITGYRNEDEEADLVLLSDKCEEIRLIAADTSGLIIGISHDNTVLLMNEDGVFEKSIYFPRDTFSYMRASMAHQPGKFYLYGTYNERSQNVAKDKGVIFKIKLIDDEEEKELWNKYLADGYSADRVPYHVMNEQAEWYAEISDDITAMTDSPYGTYVATRSGKVFHLHEKNKQLIFALPPTPNVGGIHSLACSAKGDILFFSAGSSVYAMKDSNSVVIPLTLQLGGTLKWHNDVLYVFDPDRKYLIGIENIYSALSRNDTSRSVDQSQ